MAQTTNGLRAILSMPAVYSLFQAIMGSNQTRADFVREFVRAKPGMRVLDVGCGPADILSYLPDVKYLGFDISEAYIRQARSKWGHRAQFHCQELSTATLEPLPPFDLVLVLGVLHHLDDHQALGVLTMAHSALTAGGRIVTIDPCLEPGQNPLARLLVSRDRGQNVRSRSAYERLAASVFSTVRVEVRHQRWIPYTHCFMECTR